MQKKYIALSIIGLIILGLIGYNIFYQQKKRQQVFSAETYGNVSDYSVQNSYRRTQMNDPSLFLIEIDGAYGIADVNNDFVIPLKYSRLDNEINEYGLIRAAIDDKWGYINKKDSVIIPFIFSYIGDFNDGIANAQKGDNYGTIDHSGNVVIPFEYTYLGEIEDDMIPAIKNNKFGFVGNDGNEKIAFIYDTDGDNYFYFTGFKDGLATVKKNGKWGMIDKQGKEVIPFDYDMLKWFDNGLCAAIKNEKAGFINTKNETVIPFEFDPELYNYAYEEAEEEDETTYLFNSLQLAIVAKDKKFGIITDKGEWKVTPDFDFITAFTQDFYVFEINDKWGVNNMDGKNIIEPKYNYIDLIKDGNYFYTYDDKSNLSLVFDNSGKQLDSLEAKKILHQE